MFLSIDSHMYMSQYDARLARCAIIRLDGKLITKAVAVDDQEGWVDVLEVIQVGSGLAFSGFQRYHGKVQIDFRSDEGIILRGPPPP